MNDVSFGRFFLRVRACHMVGQTLAFSVLLFLWHRRPRRAWAIPMTIAVAIVFLSSLAGALLPAPATAS